VVADALRQVDPVGAFGAEQESNWRTGYLVHFRRLVEAGLTSKKAALAVATEGLESLHRRMRVVPAGGTETGLDTLLSAPARRSLGTITVPGTGAAESELSLPYHGERLRGSALLSRLDAWVAGGVVEPSCADAVRTVAAHPEWLGLADRTVVVLGAGSEVGPLPALLSWGARVIGVDLPSPAIWERVLDTARRSGGTLLVPVARDADEQTAQPGAGDEGTARCAGLDLTADVPAVADWLATVDGPLVLGNYGLRRWRGQCAPRRRRRRAHPCACRLRATTSRSRSSPRRPTCSRSRPMRSRSPFTPTRPVASGEAGRRPAADAVRRTAAPPRLPARR